MSTCPDCAVPPGTIHQDGCDIARCRLTGQQRLQCDHVKEDDCGTVWTGEWPGVVECRELGWYVRLVPGRGWMPCAPEDEEATEDLHRLAVTHRWDFENQRMVPKRGTTESLRRYGQALTLSGSAVVVTGSSAGDPHCWLAHLGDPDFKSHLTAQMAGDVLGALTKFLGSGTCYYAFREDHGALIGLSSEHRSETYETVLHVHYGDALWFTMTQDGARSMSRALVAFIGSIISRWADGDLKETSRRTDVYEKNRLVYVTIGNSDHKLSQQDWADFTSRVRAVMEVYASEVHGVWSSDSTQPYQNACYGFEIAPGRITSMRDALNSLRSSYRQDAIAWAEAELNMIEKNEGWTKTTRA